MMFLFLSAVCALFGLFLDGFGLYNSNLTTAFCLFSGPFFVAVLGALVRREPKQPVLSERQMKQ